MANPPSLERCAERTETFQARVGTALRCPMEPEPWLRGPLPGVDPYLMPAAHALTHAGEDLARAVADLPAERSGRGPEAPRPWAST